MTVDLGLRTTTGKLLLFYTAVFGAMTLIAIAIIHTHWMQSSMREVRATLSEQAAGLSDVFRDEGVVGLRREIEYRNRSRFDPDALYALWSANGLLIAGNIAPQLTLPVSGVQEIQLSVSLGDASDQNTHDAIALMERLADQSVLLVGRDVQARMEMRTATLQLVRWTLAFVFIFGVGGALLGGRQVLRQLDAVATTTRRIAAGELEQRVLVRGSGDEFDRLATAINQMLDRISELNVGMQSVVDSVAHDLRGPLTHARQALETALAQSNPEARAAIGDAGDALDRIRRTLDALLQIVQADAGVNAGQMERCALDGLVRDVVELYEPAASTQGVRMVLNTQPVWVLGHRQLLAQAVSNLIDNALKYAPKSETIRVDVGAVDDVANIEVRDQGPGIPSTQHQRVVNRFVRMNADSEVPGSGLGLSLVIAVARLHRGSFTLAESNPGLSALLELPVAAALTPSRR